MDILSQNLKEDSLTIYPGKRYDIVINAGQPGKRPFHHAINMPPGAKERLSESETGLTADDTKDSHQHEHQSPLPTGERDRPVLSEVEGVRGDSNQQNMTKLGSEVTIMVLDVQEAVKEGVKGP